MSRATIVCATPRVKAGRACSLVCPSAARPLSKPRGRVYYKDDNQPVLFVRAGVHVVEGNNHRCHTKGEGRKGVLVGLSISSPFSLDAPAVYYKDGNISLRSSVHVLDEISMTEGINNGEGVLGALELGSSGQ